MSLKRLKLIMFMVGLLASACENPADRQRLNKLHEIASETPVYPDFKLIATSEAAKSTIAVLSNSYSSEANFYEVKEFYVRELTHMGWKLSGGGSSVEGLEFSRGAYKVSIEYTGEKYFVDYSWGAP